ncbi:MAG: endonuclease III [Phycisphaera sp.]|nr:endonuclease III [Phycisphaera sp.]
MAKKTTGNKSTTKKTAKKPGTKKKRTSGPDAATKQRAVTIYDKLAKQYPQAKCALDHEDAFQLLIATMLSAQCTDERVNMVTPVLFKKWSTPKKLAAAKQEDVEKVIHSTGFFRQKAKSLIATSTDITEKHGGKVPDTMDELTSLRGVARKTANVVLGNAYGQNVGVVVDTHVRRLTNRMGFTKHEDPVKIEQDLMATFPRDDWTMLSHLLIWHGRKTCNARKPDCANCVLKDDCPKIGVETKKK